MRVSKGDQFWRGLNMITVSSSSKNVIFSVDGSSDEIEMTRPQFFSRSILRVPLATNKKFNPLKQMWLIVSNKQLDYRERADIARKYAKMAKSIEDARIIRRWLMSLANGEEPKGIRGV